MSNYSSNYKLFLSSDDIDDLDDIDDNDDKDEKDDNGTIDVNDDENNDGIQEDEEEEDKVVVEALKEVQSMKSALYEHKCAMEGLHVTRVPCAAHKVKTDVL